jgi:tripartite-type tricarboxylate transporter receptor subunit TctC
VPTIAESGLPEFNVTGWYGIDAPLKTPRPVIAKLNHEIVDILRQPDVAARLAGDGSEPVGSTPEDFDRHIRSEVAKWAKLTKQLNIRMD